MRLLLVLDEATGSAMHPDSTRHTGFGDLPPALLARARRRLSGAALATFGLLLTTQLLTPLWILVAGEAGARYAPGGDLASAGICLALWLLCRARWIGDAAALRVGLVAEVLLCASLSLLDVVNGHYLFGRAPTLGYSTLVIAVFPWMVPSHPRITLWTSLCAALTAPLAVGAAALLRLPGAADLAPVAEAVAVATCPLLAVVIAYLGSRTLHHTYVDVEALRQQQSLLDTLLEQVDAAVVLTDAAQRLVYANGTARRLLLRSGAERGAPLQEALHERAATALGAPLSEDGALVTVVVDGEPEALQMTRRAIDVAFRPHVLFVARRVTQALRAREIAAYKRIVRVIVHELNNSLAAIGSALGSAQRVLGDPQHAARLQSAFVVILGRVKHLGEFLESYARLARLPAPRPSRVAWQPFLAELRGLHAFEAVGEPPAGEAWFDPGQMQQVLLNLLKNAEEAGSPEGGTQIEVSQQGDEFTIRVSDRGAGLTEEAWRHAMTPLFSTKPKGSGLGLALCREILEAHGGRLGLFPREGGGTTVCCWLPAAHADGER